MRFGGGVNVHILERGNKDVAERNDLDIVRALFFQPGYAVGSHILMLEMLQQLQFTVSPLRQDRSAEGLHNLLNRNMLSCELILGRAGAAVNTAFAQIIGFYLDQAYHTRPNAPMPTGWRSEYLRGC